MHDTESTTRFRNMVIWNSPWSRLNCLLSEMRLLYPGIPVMLLTMVSTAFAQTTIVIDSWRDDDRQAWQDVIIPAFEALHPDIRLEFRTSEPTAYDATLDSRLETGTAGDLITCRPFDRSLALYQAGHLADLGDLKGMENFSTMARSAWQTDDGLVTFCVPVASVIHGFLYNGEILDRMGLEEPGTEAEFFDMLDGLHLHADRIPIALGLRDRWEAATVGYNNIGPNYWEGETGREALLAGRQKLTDENWIAPFRILAKWESYLGGGYKTRSYRESREMFASGQAVIYPSGSWDIAGLSDTTGFEIRAFRPPVIHADDTCYISDHIDMAIGLNTASRNVTASRVFLEWITSVEFASLHANALPGFFPLADHAVEIENPVANAFLSWRDECESTIRFASQYLSRGIPNLEHETWDAAVDAISGTATAEELGFRLQEGLDRWYAPRE